MVTETKSIEVTDSNFDEEVLQSTTPVLVDFGADWCPPCKAISPIVDMLATEYTGKAKIAKLDVDANPYITSRYGVRNLPTLLFFKNGKPVDKIVGAVPKRVMADKLNQYV
ncbi:thioredoxin [Rhodocytophaga aerolata]|uniref:Thioredoxin n=1 Tax=Rhodocytophaga aerolata TaxID=455078 RepID=A0ABT8RAS8_9BACT|nr:thioredoxin [Rhodocytophaga aerolata]MDO1449206.1 thioredoxin [Rhodocytophaga aerolata]